MRASVTAAALIAVLTAPVFAGDKLRFDLDLPGSQFDDVTEVHINSLPSSGAEDADLWKLRAANRGTFHTLFYTMGSPHVAMVGMRALTGDGFDRVIFGGDELVKSPFAWWKAVLAPGVMSVQYIMHFFDTNPYMSLLLSAAHMTSDVVFWLQIGTIVAKPAEFFTTARGVLLYMAAWAFFAALHHHVIFPLTPAILVDVVFYVFVLIAPALALRHAWYLARALHVAYQTTKASSKALDKDVQAAVQASLSSSRPLFDSEKWSDLYEILWHHERTRDTPEGKAWPGALAGGSFGAVYEGRVKRTYPKLGLREGQRVALKFMKVRASQEPVDLALTIVMAALRCDPTQLEARTREALTRMLTGLTENPWAATSARHELLALRAANAIGHPRIIKLLSAHEPLQSSQSAVLTGTGGGGLSSLEGGTLQGGSHEGTAWPPLQQTRTATHVTSVKQVSEAELLQRFKPYMLIVTEFVDGEFYKLVPSLSPTKKLRLLKRGFEAVSTLHAGGIVHRDLHPSNIAVSARDPTLPTILDLGLAFLPGVNDPWQGQGRETQFPPEYFRFIEHGSRSSVPGTILGLAKGGLLPPADVWAMGIHAVWVLFGTDPVIYMATLHVIHNIYKGDFARANEEDEASTGTSKSPA